MRILVYGSGPLGSLFAARLLDAGHDVSLLARGQRLADLRQHGLVLVDDLSGRESVSQPRIVERLLPDDAYDLVLVIMRKNHALEILPVLAANQKCANILFLMNNAAGPGELLQALGEQRVMIGFPMAAGYRKGYVIHYLAGGGEGKETRIPIGEANGQITARLQQTGDILASMDGFAADLRTDMDAWLKTHVALLMPSLAPAIRAAGRDNLRMARTRDAILLAVRAIREGFRVVQALGFPIVPEKMRLLMRMPEPLLVPYLRKIIVDPRFWSAMTAHGEAAQDEIKHLANEFIALKKRTAVPTPAMDRLYAYFDPHTEPLPDGSATLAMDWRFLWGVAAVLVGVLVVGIMIVILFI